MDRCPLLYDPRMANKVPLPDLDNYIDARDRNQMRMHQKRPSHFRDADQREPKRYKGRKTRMLELKQDPTPENIAEYNRLFKLGPAVDDPVQDEANIKEYLAKKNTLLDKQVHILWVLPGAISDNHTWKFVQPCRVYYVEDEWEQHSGKDLSAYNWSTFCRLPFTKRNLKHGDVRIHPDGSLERLTTYYLTAETQLKWVRFQQFYKPFGHIVHKNNYYHPSYSLEGGPLRLLPKAYYKHVAEAVLQNKRDELVTTGLLPTWTRCKHEMQ